MIQVTVLRLLVKIGTHTAIQIILFQGDFMTVFKCVTTDTLPIKNQQLATRMLLMNYSCLTDFVRN